MEAFSKKFQSTPSVGRATNTKRLNSEVLQISIHALRGEGDRALTRQECDNSFISIHALRGEGDSAVAFAA